MDIEVRILMPDDVTKEYVDWFGDEVVTRYSENKFKEFSLEGQQAYVSEKLDSETDHLYGIFVAGRHVGNVLLGPINLTHRHAEVTYLLGDRSYWGKGVMSRAIAIVVDRAFTEFDLVRVYANTYENNLGSIGVLEKCGFIPEGRRKSHFLHEGKRVDMMEFGLVR